MAIPDSVREGYERFNNRNWDDYDLPDDYEFQAPPDLPGGTIYRGEEGLRRFATELDEAFGSFRAEPLEVVAAGDDAVVIKARIVATGRHTGLDIDREEFHVLNVDRDQVVHTIRCFARRAEAMQAANLADK